MFELNVISSSTPITSTNGVVDFTPKKKNVEETKEFSNVLDTVLGEVNKSQLKSNGMVEKFVKGEDVSMHEVMIAVQEAQMSMQMLVEARNKIVEAYQEINRISL